MKIVIPFASRIAIALSAVFILASCDQMKTSQNDMGTSSPPTSSSADVSGSSTLQREEYQAKAAVADAAITAKVKTAVLDDPTLKVLKIHVDTVNGVVTLTGAVDSITTAEHVSTVATNVEGVKSVSNRLQIKSTG